MPDRIDPIRGAGPVDRSPRRDDDAEAPSPPSESRALTVISAPAPAPPPAARAQAAFAAQLLAGPQRRGLRGGATVLGDAKSAYLGAEWSGHADRRTRKGRITKTEI